MRNLREIIFELKGLTVTCRDLKGEDVSSKSESVTQHDIACTGLLSGQVSL